jgi:hypothetical protein
MVRLEKDGDEREVSVRIRVRSRPVGGSDWTYEKELVIRNSTRDPFYYEHKWALSSRVPQEMQITRLTEESLVPEKMDRVQLVAIQGIRPEYWNNFDQPLCLVGIQIKASYQLSGGLDSYNAIAQRICLDWDYEEEEWVERATRNPASLSRLALQGPQNAKPKTDDEVDLETLQDWHDFCRIKSLQYDRVHDFEASLEDTLVVLASAGRASPRHDGTKWTWVLDRPQTVVIDEFNARNSRSFRWETTYSDPPHAFRVPFLDRTNDYQGAERIIPWPGVVAEDITITEQLDLAGKTNPDEIWIEARRRMHEARYRTTTYQLITDSVTRPAVRGSLVMLNQDVLQRSQKAARVIDVQGSLVVLDDIVEMDSGTSYAIRWRWYADAEDAIGESTVRQVMTIDGESRTVSLLDDARLPAIGAVVHFGPLISESLPVVVKSVEPGEDMTSIYTFIATSDLIDDDTDAEIPPEWSGRVGTELTGLPDEPGIPTITRILSGRNTGDQDGLLVFVVDNQESDVEAVEFDVDHRLFGDTIWGTVTIAAADNGAEITGYTNGDAVEVRARGRSIEGTYGLYTDIIDVVIGEDDGGVPADLPAESIEATGGMGMAVIRGVTGDDLATVYIQIYRSLSDDPGDIDRDADAVGEPFLVTPETAWAYTDGDPSRTNLIFRADFSSGKGWTKGTGWTVADGVASHAAGTESNISRSASLTNNRWYRFKVEVEDYVAGEVWPRLFGGTAVNGANITANGVALDRFENPTGAGNDTFAMRASDDFDGSIDDLVLYKETAACIDQGTWYYFAEPQNASGVPGNLAGPYQVTII